MGVFEMTVSYHRLLELINDPICLTLMERDGVTPRDVVNLMRSVKPVVVRGAVSSVTCRRSLAA
jgi:hypothetical protein